MVVKKNKILKRKQVRRSLEEREKLLSEYRKSGQTQREYCREHKLSLATLTLWLGRERRKKSSKFVRVTVKGGPMSAMIEVVLANGRVLRSEAGVEVERLLALVSTLERVC